MLLVGEEMDQEQMRAAKARLVAQMQAGQPWHIAAATAGLQTSQSTAYRLCQTVRERGEVALQNGRHGHPAKLRGEVRTFLEASCRKAPQTPSSIIQAALRKRFDLSVSISQINRVRARLGVSNRPQNQEQGKKGSKRGPFISSRMAGRCWQSSVTRRCPANGPPHGASNSPLAKPPHR